MSLDLDILKAQHRDCLGQLPCRVTIGGVVYTGTKTQVQADRLYMDPGRAQTYRFSMMLSRYDFRNTTEPAINSTVTIGGVTYRILAKSEDGAGISLRLDLGEQYAVGKGGG